MSQKNVRLLQTDPKARWQGYMFYFKEGFCWNNVLQYSNDNTTFIKCRFKQKSINDVASMSLYNYCNKTNIFYFVSLLNAKIMYNYLKLFINNSVNLQINNFRLFPIIIPTQNQLKELKEIFNNCVNIQKQKFNNKITEEENKLKLNQEQIKLDKIVNEIYKINS